MRGRLLSRTGKSSLREKRAIISSSQLQERSVAKQLGGERVSGSGSKTWAKGDVKTPDLLVECKRTDKLTYRLKLSELQKITVEALKAGKIPVMVVEIHGHFFAITRLKDYNYGIRDEIEREEALEE